MTGELILENSGWKRRLPAMAATAVAEAAVVWPAVALMLRRGVHGLMLQISTGVLVLVLWWALYPVLSRAFSKGKDSGRVRWTLTEEQLTHVTGEPELLDEALTARFFASQGSHIVFPCDSGLIFS